MGLFIDGIAASEHIDSTGEILVVQGCDISSFNDGTAVFNFEHTNDAADDIVGRILYGKKIFSESDCENDRQLYYWKQVKVPYVYVMGELFDEQGHPGAVAIASMMNYCRAKHEKMIVGFSIEGSTLEKDGMYLKQTVARRCAITVKPCNKSCISDILEEVPNFSKALGADGYSPLFKSRGVEVSPEFMLDIPEESISDLVMDLIEFNRFAKALTAGVPTGAAGTLTGGAALQGAPKKQLDKSLRAKILSRVRDNWDRKTPVLDFIKNDMPELGDQFKEHYGELMGDISLMKAAPRATYRSSVFYIPHTLDQKRLIDGISANKKEDNSPSSRKNRYGLKVFIKAAHNSEESKVYSSERATAYYNLARDFFGLGDAVPVTSCYLDPKDRKMHHAVMVVQNAITGASPAKYDDLVEQSARSGMLHRIAIMDFILGHSNRHIENVVFDQDGKIKLVSNDHAFEQPNHPEYWNLVEPINQVTDFHIKSWLDSLDANELYKQLRMHAFPKSLAQQCVARMEYLKEKLRYSANILDIYEESGD